MFWSCESDDYSETRIAKRINVFTIFLLIDKGKEMGNMGWRLFVCLVGWFLNVFVNN